MSEIAEKQEEDTKNVTFDEFDFTLDDIDDFEDDPNYEVLEVLLF